MNAHPKGRAVVFGFAFWYPLAGVTWQYLHYLLALRRLGWDAWYVEDSARWVYDPATGLETPDASANVARVAAALDAHGFAGRWAFRGCYPDGQCYGLESHELDGLLREADVMLNVCGAQELRDEHRTAARRLYVETDPVASQVRVAHGDQATIAALEAHDVLFSFGENLGAADCGVPVERFTWLPTRQPVVTELWAAPPPPPSAPFTTVATWRNTGKDIELGGETYYWSKDREFRKVLDLPARTPEVAVEVAIGAERDAHDVLGHHGWRLRDAAVVSGDLGTYRSYLQGSRGEFTVAKDQNVRLRSGWFSDRSACYLAAGRPVVTQDTGFDNVLPTGKGLFSFISPDEVAAAFDAIASDYEGHCRVAAELGREYFEAERVVASLLARAGLA
jgi:hypothetical protein